MLALLFTAALLAAPQPAAKPATNTLCPVMGDKVTAKGPKAIVAGQEYLLCCGGCKDKLEKHPEQYLEKDGTPKNAKKK